jgi:hypothetical protein
MRKERPNKVLRVLKMGGGDISASALSVGVMAGLDYSIVDLSLMGPVGIELSPPDMQASTLLSSVVAGRNRE